MTFVCSVHKHFKEYVNNLLFFLFCYFFYFLVKAFFQLRPLTLNIQFTLELTTPQTWQSFCKSTSDLFSMSRIT